MRVTISAKIKIVPTSEVIRTISVHTKALQFCINYAWKHKINNNMKLHHQIYYKIRNKFKLPSQLAVSCIKQACGMIKKAKSKPIIKNGVIVYNFPRVANIKGNKLVLRLLKKRQEFDFNIPNYFQKYFDNWNIVESLLRMDKKGRCYFIFTFSKEINASEMNSCTQTSVLGIDLGVNNLAVTSNSRFYNSHKIKQVKRKFKHLRSTLQSKGTRSSKRLLKKISGRETRYMTWVNHNISKDIVSNFDGNKIVMENLKGIGKQNRGRIMNYWISNWSFYQLQSFIQYKANMKGVEVVRVKPNYTSQICHRCGLLGSRLLGCFSCSHCGLSKFNADLNAGRNLAHPKLVERQVAVTQPYSRSDEIKDSIQGIIATELMAKSPAL